LKKSSDEKLLNLANLCHFLPKNFICVKIVFYRSKKCKNSPPKITTIVILGTLIKLLAMLCIFSKWNGLEMFCGHWGLVYPPWFNCTTLINKCFGMQAINWSTKIFQSIPMVYHSLELLPNVRFWYLFTCKGFYFFEKLHCLQPWKQKNCIFCKYVKPINKKFVIFFFYVCVCLATCIISNVNIASNMLGTMVKYFGKSSFFFKKNWLHIEK